MRVFSSLTFLGVFAHVASVIAQCSTTTPSYVPSLPGVTWPNWNTAPTGCPSAGATPITATTSGTVQSLNATNTTYYAASGTYVYGEIRQTASTNRMNVVVCQGAVLWLGVNSPQSSTHVNVVVLPGGTLIPTLISNSSKLWKGKTYIYGNVVSSNADVRIENINSGDSSMTYIAPSGIFQVAGTTTNPGPTHNTQLYFASGSGIMGIYNEGSVDVSDLYINSSGTAICSNNENSCLRIRNSVPALNTDDQLAANLATGGYMIFDATSGSTTLNKRVSSASTINVCTYGADWCKSGGGCCIKTAGCTTGSPFAGSALNTNCATLPASCSVPLKAYLAGFRAERTGEGIKVSWITTSQENSKWFEVEKSRNGMDWSKIGELPAAGNSSSTLTYSLTDPTPWLGDSYYRLKEIDVEGKGTVYAVDGVYLSLEESEFLLSPNPSSGIVTVSLADAFEQYDLEVTDLKGSIVGHYILFPGANILSIQTPGMYLAKLKIGRNVVVKKFIVQ